MEELLSEIMKLYVHAIGKKLDEDIMADEIKLNRATAEKIVEWLQDNCKRYDKQGYYVIRAKYIARYINSLVVEDEVMSRDQAKKVLRGLGLGELNEAPPGGYSLTSLEEARIPRDAWWKVESMDVDQLHPKTQAEVTKRKILEFINKYPKINNTQLLGLSNCISWLEQE